ncbi:hypothetical protein B0T24DRAFT_585089 [Lasiosphaeria ovina]|uniref:DNA 3'-5' helicase n=1 Tax=Lasiosphaeria ovina TaxID=92902 RepID=A0AAE0JTX4_9PEZI|nr:hypothetical protein B0T24DRAFT_585089 [Lasiosphaeria ovina]
MSGTWLPNPTRGASQFDQYREERRIQDNFEHRGPSISASQASSLDRFALQPAAGRNGSPLASRFPHTQGLYDDGLDDFGSAGNHPGFNSSSPVMRATVHRQQDRSGHSTHSNGRSSLPIPSSSPSLVPQYSKDGPSPSGPLVYGITLINLRQNLPDKFRSVFPYEFFNAVQSKCFDAVYGGNDNVVVAAPTGSGKTAILELAICRVALDRGNENFKIVYQAPTKALCFERARDWEKKFSHMNFKCAELTGDTSQAEMNRIGDASIIVTTPEKWDSITRRWHDHRRLLQMVELFLIDEVHILKDVRGATLEAVVSRMKTIGANVRFIALSATVPNSDDIATWLGRNHTNQHLPAHRETFGEEFRPVKLQKYVYGYDHKSNDFIFDNFLDTKLPTVLQRHNQKKPIMIFCFTRKSCESTASLLADYVSNQQQDNRLWPMPSQRIPVLGRELQEIVRFGVAFHHAGLDAQDRVAVEQGFLKGQLSVICCTSTLAVGVNLPCHTVVLKGTVGYTDDKLQEYSDLEVMQMLGRAGRPQFDDSATAIIFTRAAQKNRYERMVSGQEILESTLHLNLIEHLNSEICLRTITDLPSAKGWLGGTFLSVRLRRNPDHYQLTGSMSNPSQIDNRLEEICERDIKLLQEAEVVTDGETFKCTEYGRAMSRYMVEFTTMKLLLQIPRAARIEALITILSQASEFKDFRMKPTERTMFREINQSPLIMYPIRDAIGQTSHKISLMVQAHLGSVQYPDSKETNKLKHQLMVERKAVFERLQRLVRAVADCKGHDRDAVGTKNALELTRALAAGSWEDRATQLTQIPNIGPAGMRKLAGKNIRTVLELADKDYGEIERLMSRQPPFGRKIQEVLEMFPRLDFDMTTINHKAPSRNGGPVILNVGVKLRCLNRKGLPRWRDRLPGLTFLAETSDGTLAWFWRGGMKKIYNQSGLELKFSVELKDFNDSVICHFNCEEIVGTQVSKVLHHNLSRAAFPSASRTHAGAGLMQSKKAITQNYLDDDDIEDSDFLEAAEKATVQHPATQPIAESFSQDSNEYPPVEDLLAETFDVQLERQRFDRYLAADDENEGGDMDPDQYIDREPVQLPNGKWQCNHACSGGARTKSGKLCTHRCCKDGLDRPRKRHPPRLKKRKARDEADENLDDIVPAKLQPKVQPKSTPGPQTKRLKAGPESSKSKMDSFLVPDRSIGKASLKSWKPMDFDDMDIECIDLSMADDKVVFPSNAVTVHQSAATNTSKAEEERVFYTEKEFTPARLEPKKGTSSPDSKKRDYFDGDDSSFLDDILFAEIHKPRQTPFRTGGSDVVLYQGTSRRSAGTGLDVFSDELIPVSRASVVRENGESSKPDNPSSSMFLQGTKFNSSSATPGSEADPLTVDDILGPESPTVEDEISDVKPIKEEPAWVSGFDQDFVNLFRGYVTFV